MIGGWRLYTRYRVKAMYGNQKDGSQIVERFISVTIVDIISEHNKFNFVFLRISTISKYINLLRHFQSESAFNIVKQRGYHVKKSIEPIFYSLVSFFRCARRTFHFSRLVITSFVLCKFNSRSVSIRASITMSSRIKFLM